MIGPPAAKRGGVLARWLKVGAPLVVSALVAVALAALGSLIGEARLGSAQDSVGPARAPARHARDAGVDASWRFGPNGEIVAPPGDENYRCVQPALEIPKTDACAAGRGYPHCRWQIPLPGDSHLYEIWRNTVPDHRWGRPSLVSLILASAAEYARRWPGEHIAVGDLDAPGPRHSTHSRGVDVDLYLLDAMMTRNEGHRRYVDNYEHRSTTEVRLLRARVMDFARILAVCAGGRIRIYYNDPEIIEPFRQWFDERGLHSDVGPPMRRHNHLHEFHFHLTTPEDLAPLPIAD